MSYEHKRKKFFLKNSYLKKWKIDKIPSKKIYNHIVSIPCYSEYDYIFDTLDSINKESIKYLSSTLISIVINNSDKCNHKIFENNLATFKKIKTAKYHFDLVIIDCFNKNNAFSKKEAGVGLARKLSIDLVLKYSHLDTIISFLDADTIVSKNYLLKLKESKKNNSWKCAVVNFKHLNDEIKTNKIIKEYEVSLKAHAKKMMSAGSPYDYVPLGSTMVCTSFSYISVGGMNVKKAAEDFYFLQEMQKCYNVFFIDNILVHPSSRYINRSYIGTSKRLYDVLSNKNSITDFFFNEKAYLALSYFLKLVLEKRLDSTLILNKVKNKDKILFNYLIKINFKNIMNKLILIKEDSFVNEFHRWFDNLKTIKLLKLYR